MSQLESIARTVAWGVGFAGLGLASGVLIDGIFGSRLKSLDQPLMKGFAQLAVGLALLSEVIAIVIPADTVAPLSDGLMFYWFFEAQPHMRHNLSAACAAFSKFLFGQKSVKPAPFVSSTPPSDSASVDGSVAPPPPVPAPSSESSAPPPSVSRLMGAGGPGMWTNPFDPTRPLAKPF